METAETVLDLYKSGKRVRKSLWDNKSRDKPLPYIHSQRGKIIALEKSMKQYQQEEKEHQHRHYDREHFSQHRYPDEEFSHGNGINNRFPDERNRRNYNPGRFDEGHRQYNNSFQGKRNRFAFGEDDREYRHHREGERYDDENNKRGRYMGAGNEHETQPRQPPINHSLESRMNALSGAPGAQLATPTPVAQLPQAINSLNSSQTALLTPVQLAQLNQLITLQNSLAQSGVLSPSILGSLGANIGAVGVNTTAPVTQEHKQIKAPKGKTKIQFPRFELLPAEGIYIPDQYPYYCFLAEITAVTAPKLTVKDVRGEETIVMFSPNTEFGSFSTIPETFSWADLIVGRTVAILKAKTQSIPSERSKGIVINKGQLCNVFVFTENLANICSAVLKFSGERPICFFSSCQASDLQNLEPCADCNLALYCSEEHQRKSWFEEGHDKICQQMPVINKLVRTNFTDTEQFKFSWIARNV